MTFFVANLTFYNFVDIGVRRNLNGFMKKSIFEMFFIKKGGFSKNFNQTFNFVPNMMYVY